MIIEIILLLSLILCNGIFSMSEIAVVSARKSRLENAVEKKQPGARRALSLANAPNRFLSTVQIGITLIGILTGVFGSGKLAGELAALISRIPIPVVQAQSQSIAVGIVVLITTYLTLIVGELVPKRIGLLHPESIARLVAPPMTILSRLSAPLVWVLVQSTELFMKLFRIQPSDEPPVTEEEVKSLIAQGTHTGMFEEVEQHIVERVFMLSDRRVSSIMTHKMDFEWIDVQDDDETNRQKILRSLHSRFPLCDGSIDNVTGVVYTKKILESLLQRKAIDFRAIAEPAVFIPETMQAYNALETFKKSNGRMAIIVDEFGTVQGLLTVTNIVDAVIGEVENDHPEESDIVAREDGSYLVDAMIPFEEFVQHFHVSDVKPDDKGSFHTLGGLIIDIANQIPQTGEQFNWKDFRFEIMDMDGNRIDKVLVSVKK